MLRIPRGVLLRFIEEHEVGAEKAEAVRKSSAVIIVEPEATYVLATAGLGAGLFRRFDGCQYGCADQELEWHSLDLHVFVDDRDWHISRRPFQCCLGSLVSSPHRSRLCLSWSVVVLAWVASRKRNPPRIAADKKTGPRITPQPDSTQEQHGSLNHSVTPQRMKEKEELRAPQLSCSLLVQQVNLFVGQIVKIRSFALVLVDLTQHSRSECILLCFLTRSPCLIE
jgi:hypothetical protein